MVPQWYPNVAPQWYPHGAPTVPQRYPSGTPIVPQQYPPVPPHVQAYERGVALFRWPNVADVWHTYLSKFVGRYGGRKLERARDLFEQALDGCPPKYAKSKGGAMGWCGVVWGGYGEIWGG